MESMRCCTHLCSDVRKENGFYLLHSGTWDCEKRGDGDEGFLRRFQHLPLELKLHVFSFCHFHVLANTELWLRDVDPHLLPGLLRRNPHFASPECTACSSGSTAPDVGRRPTFSLATEHVRAHLTFRPRGTVAKLPKGSPLTEKECRELSDTFGKTNRHTCFYYRRCAHHDMSTPPPDKPSEQECWTRLARSTGLELKEDSKSPLSRLSLPTSLPSSHGFFPPTRPNAPLVYDDTPRGSHVLLRPGMYYFELVDHTWENMVAACDDRSRHFFVDPSNEAHKSAAPPRGRICMSLVFRRVAQPAAEVGDAFRTVKRFHESEDRSDRALSFPLNSSKEILVNFPRTGKMRRVKRKWEANREDGIADELPDPKRKPESWKGRDTNTHCSSYTNSRVVNIEPHLVYKHSLTPSLFCSLSHWTSTTHDIHPNRHGYVVRFCKEARLFSIEENGGGFRINFFVDVGDLSLYDKIAYVDAMAKLVNGEGGSFYAFMVTSSDSKYRIDHEKLCHAQRVFERLFK